MGIILENKVIQKFTLSNNVNNKKCAPKLICLNGKKLEIQCTLDLVTHLVCQKTVTKSRGVTK